LAVEMERKFLVLGNDWKKTQGTYVCQGYLNRDKERTVRVRIAGPQAFLTIKGSTTGFSRTEFEYEIPVDHAEQMLKLCDDPLIEKIRYTVNEQGFCWEIDEFLGDNKGLAVAEIELESPDQEFIRPGWLGEEVTENPRYFNSNLAVDPYLAWCKPKDG
jgi:CYTH domain-containing protein